MDLSSVLNVIAKHSEDLGLNHPDLYTLLFEGKGIDPTIDVTQTAKNIFSRSGKSCQISYLRRETLRYVNA